MVRIFTVCGLVGLIRGTIVARQHRAPARAVAAKVLHVRRDRHAVFAIVHRVARAAGSQIGRAALLILLRAKVTLVFEHRYTFRDTLVFQERTSLIAPPHHARVALGEIDRVKPHIVERRKCDRGERRRSVCDLGRHSLAVEDALLPVRPKAHAGGRRRVF